MDARLSIEQVAKEIEENKQLILSLFKQKLRNRIDLPPELRVSTFEDLIPTQIDILINALIKKSYPDIDKKLQTPNKPYPLDVIITEFIILRDAIMEVLEEKGLVDSEATSIIWKNIVNSIRHAVISYEILKENESVDMKVKLEKSDSINEAISEQIIKSRENEERFKTLVMGVEDYAVFTTDPNGFITSWNPGAERMKGYTAKEAIGEHFSILYPEAGKKTGEPMQHLHIALIEGRYRGEGMRRRKNGEMFLADVYIRPIFKDKKLLGFAKVVSDVEERNRLLQSSKFSKAEVVDLKSERKIREIFVTNLSHDLKSPLMVATAATELLARHLDPGSIGMKYVDKILSSLDRLNKMIGDLLDANKLKAGKSVHLNIHEWDMKRLVTSVCDDFETLGSEINLKIPDHEIRGKWDGEGVRRILENLLGNAFKYGDNKYPVDVSVIEKKDEICLKVHNMGEVIQLNNKDILFEQFTRAHSGKKKKGWGIGLNLVKGVVEAHGGTVEVESLPVEGTTFTVNLPRFCA